MNEKQYNKRLEFQQKMISRQSKQIEDLESKIKKLTLECQKKDELINTVEPMQNEMAENIKEYRKLKSDYQKLIDELKQMKEIINQEVYRGKWRLVKWLIK